MFYAPEFHVYTDYNALTYIKTSSKVNDTGQRWINELANFNFSIHHKPGVENVVAGAISQFLISPIEKEHCRDQYSKTCSSVEVTVLMILKQKFFMVKETINVQSVKMTS